MSTSEPRTESQRESELEHALHEAIWTVEFLHGCLTAPHVYEYVHPVMTHEKLEPAEEGHQAYIIWPAATAWEQRSNALTRNVDVGMIRATGLALLAYAEAADAA